LDSDYEKQLKEEREMQHQELVEESTKPIHEVLSIETFRLDYDVFLFLYENTLNPHIKDQIDNEFKGKLHEIDRKQRRDNDRNYSMLKAGMIDQDEKDFRLTISSAEHARDSAYAMIGFLIEKAKEERYGKNS